MTTKPVHQQEIAVEPQSVLNTFMRLYSVVAIIQKHTGVNSGIQSAVDRMPADVCMCATQYRLPMS
eukprot:CAMPEP_0202893186 /NCGR_PEP_ID=MMETSP1392-20130828/2814_1 /ASSEMBLY_ACC=CAM_ASM_000868 /TAXON_ID=225041 /ORGANISM="Chlamydomonas chlamydogama, Strain SAG 11-48b" /LENGTH=65 /DNA_ID=CAMNT_0049577427 /DNA_START=41 /DNA_END=235 /DNA_ORIENTATION=-